MDSLYLRLIADGYSDDELTKVFDGAKDEIEIMKKLNFDKRRGSLGIDLLNILHVKKKTKDPQEKITWRNALKKPSQKKIEERETTDPGKVEIRFVGLLKTIKIPKFTHTGKQEIQEFDFNKMTLKKLVRSIPSSVIPNNPNKSEIKQFKLSSNLKISYINSKRFELFYKEKNDIEIKNKEDSGNLQSTNASQILSEKVTESDKDLVAKEISENTSNSLTKSVSGKNIKSKEIELDKSFNTLKISKSTVTVNENKTENLKRIVKKFRKPELNDPVAPDPCTDYFKQMSKYRVIESTDPSNFNNFSFSQAVNLSQKALKRITKELESLRKNLPCSPEASVFLMYDSQDMGKMKVLITGPSETPYAHGFFLFDIRILENYPESPPLVMFCTAINRNFQFGPNFLKSGEICLSLINTWQGSAMERWNPSSTLLQLLISIQSLAMGNKIIQKKSEFEKLQENSEENKMYQIEVKYGNLKYSLLETLKNPPLGFEEIIKTQISLTKTTIEKTLTKWVKSFRRLKPCPDFKSDNSEICKILYQSGFKSMHSLFLQIIEILDLNILNKKI